MSTSTTKKHLETLNTKDPSFSKSPRYYRSGKMLYLSFIRKSPVLVTITFLISILSSFATTLPTMLIGVALDVLDSEGFTQQFIIIAVSIIIISLFYVVITFVSNYLFLTVSFNFEKELRQEYFDAIQGHSLTFHDENNSSKLLSIGMTEIQQIRMGINPSLRILSQVFFAMIITTFFMYTFQPIYALLNIIGLVLYFLLAYRYSRRISPLRYNLSESNAKITEISQEIFRGIEVVHGFSSADKEKIRFNRESSKFRELSKKEGKLQAFYWPGIVLLILTVTIFGLGVADVYNGTITAGNLISAVALLLALQNFNFLVPMSLLNIRAALTNSNRLWEKLNWQDPQPDLAYDSIPEINWKGDIVFDNMNFSYDGKPALKDISLKIPGGSKVALIGGPGSGKSTFLKILLRLYDPQEGTVYIDGHNYNLIPAIDIRDNVSRVEQEIFLFSGTIKENIAFAKPGATDEEIITAAKTAQGHEFINEMPQNYDSIIGERGVTLSGGQRQRVAIARAILADSNILLLDDSVSAVDSKTELLIRKALDNLMENRTSITVTQRLNTLVRADLIILLDKGKVIGLGKHEELLQTSYEYRRIFEFLPESEQVLSPMKEDETQ